MSASAQRAFDQAIDYFRVRLLVPSVQPERDLGSIFADINFKRPAAPGGLRSVPLIHTPCLRHHSLQHFDADQQGQLTREKFQGFHADLVLHSYPLPADAGACFTLLDRDSDGMIR